MKKQKAFTLAEVLVTLGIIGTIAAITVPALKKHAEETTYYTATMKAHSTISNAVELLKEQYGPIRFWNLTSQKSFVEELLLPKLNIMKNCKNSGGCYDSDYKVKKLDGVESPVNNFQTQTRWYTFVTSDGLYWAISPVSNPICSADESTYLRSSCIDFEVDVNGPQPPNTIGVDIQGFTLTAEGLFPMGGCPGCNTSDCNSSGVGWGCTAKLIKEGKITW